ncbi:hypothetical protein OTK49_03320 [Vibrio coralliirubri]|uniref:hypothetical protein n=1 Tax=Vibrio coralliirubri TaxID=1516159 RepID=UPI0022838CCF|nr:hypothetical protein [Vibrio coralliirubri]MCY9861547.1 hypothetical protein [Vibrio coralliirubri]
MQNFIFSPSQGLFVDSRSPFTFLPDEASKFSSENANILLTGVKQPDTIVVESKKFTHETFDEVTVLFTENLLGMDGSDCADFANGSLGMDVSYKGNGVWHIDEKADQTDDDVYASLLPAIQGIETKTLVDLFNREFETQIYFDGVENFLVKNA